MQHSRFVLGLGLLTLLSATPAFAQTAAEEPTTLITRADFVKQVVDKLYSPKEIEHCYRDITSGLSPDFSLLYSDVPADRPYGKELCIAMRDGLAQGYKDGSFHPNKLITFAEASKILAKAYGLAPYADTTKEIWYAPYAYALSQAGAIPFSVTTFDHAMTKGETAEMLERLSDGITVRPSRPFGEIKAPAIQAPAPVKKAVKQTSVMVLPKKTTTIAPAGGSASSSPAMWKAPGSAASSKAPWYKFF